MSAARALLLSWLDTHIHAIAHRTPSDWQNPYTYDARSTYYNTIQRWEFLWYSDELMKNSPSNMCIIEIQ